MVSIKTILSGFGSKARRMVGYVMVAARMLGASMVRLLKRFDWRKTTHWAFMCAVILNIVAPISAYLGVESRYQVEAQASSLMGRTNPNLNAKISYDKTKASWTFNKAGEAPVEKSADPVKKLQSQVGGGGKNDKSLYSVKLPANGSEGITYTDSQAKQAFTMIPAFGLLKGRSESGRFVYPLVDAGRQLIYTFIRSN